MSRQLIWDLPVRIGHWTLVLAVGLAWASAESEQWRLVHLSAGAAAMAVVVFRVFWGFVGSQPARFAHFLKSPSAIWQEICAHLEGRHHARTSHTALGGCAVVAMLGLVSATAVTGALAYTDDTREWLAELHEALANGLLALAGAHIAATIGMSFVERQNLPLSMLTGRRKDAPAAGHTTQKPLAALMLTAWIVIAVWLARWLATSYAA